jgi:hypothetical protein
VFKSSSAEVFLRSNTDTGLHCAAKSLPKSNANCAAKSSSMLNANYSTKSLAFKLTKNNVISYNDEKNVCQPIEQTSYQSLLSE